MSAPSFFVGTVAHRRLRPRRHYLRYRAFWLLLDIDDIDAVSARLRLLSKNRFNLFSIYDGDHGDGSSRPLRDRVNAELRAVGVDLSEGRIHLFSMPRVLGYVFNPLSIFFCYDRNGRLAALLHEVHNTVGERHIYALPVLGPDAGPVAQRCPKNFYVSPFLPMEMSYAFRVHPPGEDVHIAVLAHDERGPVLTATLSAKRRQLTDAALARIFLSIPLLTLKVCFAIHWHALLIWLKGVPIHSRPSARSRKRLSFWFDRKDKKCQSV